MTSKFREKIANNKDIRDHFLDKKYNKISGFRAIGKRIKNVVSSLFTKGAIIFSSCWVMSSAFFTGISFLISNHIGITDIGGYKIIYVMVSLFVGSILSFIYSIIKSEKKDAFSDAAFWLFIPMLSSLFNSIYFINGSSVSLVFGLITLGLLLFPVTFSVIGSLCTFLKNIKFLFIKSNNVWENLTVDDHKIVSTCLDKEDFIKFLEKIKTYDDLPITDMNKIRIKEKIESKNIAVKEENKKVEEDKKQKIINYADSFYDQNK